MSAPSALISSRLRRYKTNLAFWTAVDPSVDGMLQGYAHLSPLDAETSKKFLEPILMGPKAMTKPNRALDCGAGIGRVSREVLLPLFATVDLVEQNERFVASAKDFIGEPLNAKVDKYICSGLQDFTPTERYSCIWIQWVIGYLTDDDLVRFFERCKKALSSDGFLVVKDNFKSGPQVDFDEDDGSVCRPESLVNFLINRAGFTIFKTCTQPNFPTDLYPVRILGCMPTERKRILEKADNR